jgi:HK97 family phage portal protein
VKFFSKKGTVEDRALSVENLPPVLAPALAAAEAINGRSAYQLADVFSCIKCLVDAATLCPLTFWRQGDAGREALTGGRGVNLLRNPAPGVTQPALVASLIQSLAAFGESFLGKVRDGDGNIVQLESLAPERMSVRLVAGAPLYEYYSPLDGVFQLTVADVIHVVGMRDPSGLRGASPISLCKEALGLNASLTTAASSLFSNSAIPHGLITVPSGTMSQDQISVLSDAWSKRHQGPDAAGRVAIISGDLRWQSVSLPLQDAQFVEASRLSTQTICRIFRVPPSVLGAGTSDSMTYRNAASEAESLLKFAVAPMLTLIESALSQDRDLFPAAAMYTEFDVDRVLLRADPATRAAVASQLIAAGVISPQEARDREGIPGIAPGPPATTATDAQALAESALTSSEAQA